MNIQELVKENPTINITVSGKDLQEYGQAIAKTTAETILQRKDERLYTANEVEKMFSICPATRWRWDKIGVLKGRKVGNRIYYSESLIQDLFNKKKGRHNG